MEAWRSLALYKPRTRNDPSLLSRPRSKKPECVESIRANLKDPKNESIQAIEEPDLALRSPVTSSRYPLA